MHQRDEDELLRMWRAAWENGQDMLRTNPPAETLKRYFCDLMENAVEIGLSHDVFHGVDRYEARRYMAGRRRRTSRDPAPVRCEATYVVTQQPLEHSTMHVLTVHVCCGMLHRSGPWDIRQVWHTGDSVSEDRYTGRTLSYGFDPGELFTVSSMSTAAGTGAADLTVARMLEAQRALRDQMDREAARMYGIPTQMLDNRERRRQDVGMRLSVEGQRTYDRLAAEYRTPITRSQMASIPPPRPGDRAARDEYRERAMVMVYVDQFADVKPSTYATFYSQQPVKASWRVERTNAMEMVCTVHGCTWDRRSFGGCEACRIEDERGDHLRQVMNRLYHVLRTIGRAVAEHRAAVERSVTLLRDVMLHCARVLWETTDDTTKRFVLAAAEREFVQAPLAETYLARTDSEQRFELIEYEAVPPDAYYDAERRRLDERRAAGLCVAFCNVGYCVLPDRHDGDHKAPVDKDGVDPAGIEKLLLEME